MTRLSAPLTFALATLGVLLVVVGIQLLSLGLISELITRDSIEAARARGRSDRLVDEVLR